MDRMSESHRQIDTAGKTTDGMREEIGETDRELWTMDDSGKN